MRRILFITICSAMLSSCHIYSNYERPVDLPVDSLYRDFNVNEASDTSSLGDMDWKDVFSDTLLRKLIDFGLENNTDMQIAMLRIDQAQAQLKAAKLAFLPSLTFSPQGSVSTIGSNSAVKSYELPLQASWEVDIFGNLRNAKKGAQTSLLQQQAYSHAVRSELIANIANSYFTLLMLDEQVAISDETLGLWKEQVRTMESLMKVGEEKENAVTSARANLYSLEATHSDLLRQQREAENTLCTLLGITSRKIERGSLNEQSLPNNTKTGIPIRLLSHRPDIVQAEMTLASAYYSTNQARAAFYPSLNLSGSVGWTNSLGQAVSNPGKWITSALASLTQPIFNRGKLVSNLRVSKDEEQVALLNYKQALLKAGQEVNDALYAIESSSATLASHTKQCEELERTVQSSKTLYKTGNATYLELLTANESLLNARLSAANDKFAQLQAIVSLYTALGGGA